MGTQSSYVIRGGLEGRERLRVLARVMQETTSTFFDRVGVAPGWVCLDVGAGGGDVTLELARRATPRGRAVGTDIDVAKLTLAREEAHRAGVANVEYRHEDILRGVSTGAFDLAYARFLLTHLPDPSAAAKNIVAALRPGGVVLLEDIDFSGHVCHPTDDAFWTYVNWYTKAVQRRGGDPHIGPRLPELLRAAGCEHVEARVVQPAGLSGEVKLVAALTMENIAHAVVTEGIATKDDVDRIIGRLYALACDSRVLTSLPRVVQAWGVRAGVSSASPGI